MERGNEAKVGRGGPPFFVKRDLMGVERIRARDRRAEVGKSGRVECAGRGFVNAWTC